MAITFGRFDGFRILAVLGLLLGSGEAARAEPGSLPAADARLQQKLTVRVSGMPLARLLPRLSRELGVTLRPGSTDVGDLRVALFAEALPAHQALEALTRMLNATPERGFAWQRKRGSAPSYTLTLDARARSQAAVRLRRFHLEADQRLLARIAALREDPEVRKTGEDPNPTARAFGRAPYLVGTLSDEQLQQLVQEGEIVLRYREVGPRQRQVLSRMGGDLLSRLQRIMETTPELLPLYTDIKPEEASFVFTLDRNATEPFVFGLLKLGPGKGAFRNQVYPIPSGPAPPAPAAASDPADPAPAGAPKIELRPAGWSMADVLTEMARRTRKPLVSDCYSLDWTRLRASGPGTLEQLQKRSDELWQVQWSEADGFLIGRSRICFVRQAWEVPERLAAAWATEIRSNPRLKLDTLAQMALLSKPQLESLDHDPEFQAVAFQANYFSHFFHAPMRFYGALAPAQRLRVGNGGFQLGYDEMTPAQRRAFTSWMLERNPNVPVSDYSGGNFRMTYTTEGHLDLSWKVGELTASLGTWMHLHRDLATGGPIEREKPIVDDVLGKPLPVVPVAGPDGNPRPLRLPQGKPGLVLFRSTWPVPYVGREPDGDDLRKLEAYVASRPELAGRVAAIAPHCTSAEVRAWAAERKLKLPWVADPEGSAARAGVAERICRGLVVDASGRVVRMLSGVEELAGAEWSMLLP